VRKIDPLPLGQQLIPKGVGRLLFPWLASADNNLSAPISNKDST